jgi:cobalt-zinc-cadmium efflux system outer membrane protein
MTVGVVLAFALQARAESSIPRVDLPETLSLADALRIFRARGFDLLIADAAVASANADTLVAAAIPNPVVSVGFGRVLPPYDPNACGATGPCSSNQWTLGVSDNAIFDSLSGKRGLRRDVASAALNAAKMSRVDASRVLELTIKQQYYSALQARAAYDFALEVQGGAAKTLELNRLRYPRVIDEGALARVETAKLEADAAVDAAAQDLRLAKVQLAFLLGVRGHVPDFKVDAALLRFAVPAPLRAPDVDALLRTAFDHRSDLRAVGFLRARAVAAVALARRQRFPDITLSVQYTQTGTGQSAIQPPTLGVGLSAPIPFFYQQQGEIRRAEADSTSQALQLGKLEAQVVSEVETAFSTFVTSRRLVERMESGLLERARKARDITKLQFDAGAAPLMDYLDAQRTFIATNAEYIQDLTAYFTAVAQLEAAVGADFPT